MLAEQCRFAAFFCKIYDSIKNEAKCKKCALDASLVMLV